ncbi:acid protease [Lactarius akahatsu]|uniref:Acid protease n=1 Tax=Lactarius akahatsu TaxID=416441 RepID=A0AAD4LPX7_9AGAM|nr:acid protease [Lactarius akahatsu]
MFPLFPLLFVFLAVLDAVCAVQPLDSTARLRELAPSLHRIIKRQSGQNTTSTTNSTSNVNATTTFAATVPLTLASDRQTYYSLISLGNVNLRVGLDTGSSDLWVVSSACDTAQCKSLPQYPLFYPSPSFVSVNSNATTFNVSFADTTTASGFVAEETVSLGNFTVPQQAFGLVNSSNVSFVDQVSGIFGFGFPRLSTIAHLAVNATPVFPKLAQQGLLDYPLFGVNLKRNGSAGSLSLGAVDSTIVTNVSLIEWHEVVPFEPFGSENNVSSYLQWAIPVSNITVGTQTFVLEPTYPQANSNHSVALFDVGTPGIFGPYQDVERLFSVIDGARLVDISGQWAIPCDTNLTLTVTFSDKNYTLLPSDYIIGPTSGEPALCLAWPKASPPSSDGIDWQFGAAFLQTVYTVFSYGIAKKEPPFIGLYPLQPPSAVPLSQAALSALFSSLSLTVPTTLPNFVVSTPTLTTPSYIFNTSVPTSVVAVSDLATSTYSPLIEKVVNGVTETPNVTALPGVTPAPTLATLIITDSSGEVHTTVATLTTSSVVLGRPAGYNSANRIVAPRSVVALLAAAFTCLIIFSAIFL